MMLMAQVSKQTYVKKSLQRRDDVFYDSGKKAKYILVILIMNHVDILIKIKDDYLMMIRFT